MVLGKAQEEGKEEEGIDGTSCRDKPPQSPDEDRVLQKIYLAKLSCLGANSPATPPPSRRC